MENKKIPERSQVPEEFTWDLSDIFASDDAWFEELEKIKAFPERFLAFKGTLKESAENLLRFYQLNDETEVRLTKLYGYASQKSDEDTSNAFYLDMRGKAMSAIVSISAASSFATVDTLREAFERELSPRQKQLLSRLPFQSSPVRT